MTEEMGKLIEAAQAAVEPAKTPPPSEVITEGHSQRDDHDKYSGEANEPGTSASTCPEGSKDPDNCGESCGGLIVCPFACLGSILADHPDNPAKPEP